MAHGVDDLPLHVQRIYRGAEARAIESGYHTRAFSLQEPDMTPALLDRMLFHRNVPGFVITGLNLSGKVLRGLNWSRYAMVATGFSLATPQLHRVTTNVMHGFKLVIDKAFELGYRRIGIAISQEYDQRTNHGVLFPVSYIRERLNPGLSLEAFVYTQTGSDAIEPVARWLENTRPEVAIGTWVYEAIQLLGWKIPRDIALVTFDRSPEFPDHAGLDQRYEIIGRVAADVLISEITHNRRGIPSDPVEHAIHGHWYDGSTAPPRC